MASESDRRLLGELTPKEPITQEGDLIIPGAHRLVCGDSQDPAVIARLMDGHGAAR